MQYFCVRGIFLRDEKQPRKGADVPCRGVICLPCDSKGGRDELYNQKYRSCITNPIAINRIVLYCKQLDQVGHNPTPQGAEHPCRGLLSVSCGKVLNPLYEVG